MKKARSVLEISLIAMIVIGVSIFALTLYNNLKLRLANMSKVTVNSGNVGTTIASTGPLTGLNNNRNSDIETAGSSGTGVYRGSEFGTISNQAEEEVKKSAESDLAAMVGGPIGDPVVPTDPDAPVTPTAAPKEYNLYAFNCFTGEIETLPTGIKEGDLGYQYFEAADKASYAAAKACYDAWHAAADVVEEVVEVVVDVVEEVVDVVVDVVEDVVEVISSY